MSKEIDDSVSDLVAETNGNGDSLIAWKVALGALKITKLTIILVVVLALVFIGSAFITTSKSVELKRQNAEVEKIQEDIRSRSEYLKSLQ